MGFFSSLKSQLGRDTGRFISNKIFGNRHAVKYQRVDSTGRSLLGNSSYNSSSNSNSKNSSKKGIISTFFETTGNLIKDSIKSELREKENQKQFQKKEFLKLKNSIEKLVSMKIPVQKQALIDMMFKLSIIISSNPWKNILEDDSELTSKYANIALKKYEQCLYMLKTKYPKAPEIYFLEKTYKKTRKRTFLQSFWPFVIAISFITTSV